MSEATWNEPFAGGATTNGLTSWLGVLVTWLRERSRDASPASSALVATMKRAAGEVGAPLLRATSRDDLDDRLEQAIVGPALRRLDAEAAHLITIDTLTAIAAPAEPPAEMVRVLGAGPAGIVVQSGRLHAAHASVIMQILVEHGPAALGNEELDVTAFVTAPGVHSTVKRCVVQGLRSSAALLGIVHAMMEGERPEPWLSLALAEVFRDGLYEYMRYLASLPLHVPMDLVPLAERFDLRALQHEVEAAESLWQSIADPDGELHLCGVPDDDADP
jgi:hypothetical protein